MDDTQPLFPIDMQCMRITDWLIQRNHVQTDWIHLVKKIQEKSVKPLLPSLTQDIVWEIANLSEHIGNSAKCDIPYYMCKRIFEYFLSKEGGDTDLFGSYSSRNVKSWSTVLKQYRKDALHLGETGYLITNNLKYELPYWHKQKERTKQQIQVANQKINTLIRSKDGLNEKYLRTCRGLGLSVESDFSKEEVWDFAIGCIVDDGKAKLMELFRSDIFSRLRSVIEFYTNFIRAWQTEDSELLNIDELLPILRSLFSFLDSLTPRTVEQEQILSPTEHNEFGIELVEENGGACKPSSSPTSDSNTFLPINKHSFRHDLLNELQEIEFFLNQRKNEMSDSGLDSFSITQLIETTPLRQDLESVSEVQVCEMSTLVKQIKSELNLPQIQQTYKLLRSKPYRFRLQDEILRLKAQEKKTIKKIELEEQTKDKLIRNLQEIANRIDKIISNCRYLKQLFETEASPLFNDRKVNLVGEINRL